MNRIDWSQGWEIITNVTDTTTEVYCRTEAQANTEHAMKVHFGEKPSPVRYDGETDSYTFVVNHDEDAPVKADERSAADIHAWDQATAGTDRVIRTHAEEVANQLKAGYRDDEILVGMKDYLVNWRRYTHAETTVLYMRAVMMLAKTNEKGEK